jgi:hypothetical protein
VTDEVRKPGKERNSLLWHCLARAAIADKGGEEAAIAAWGPQAERMTKWSALWSGVRLSPKASRVAGFVITWAVAMREEGCDGYSITEYQRFWNEGERQAYRLQADFRELWPEFETPNELAAQIVKYLDARTTRKDVGALALKLQVTA